MAACGAIGPNPPPRVVSQPPAEPALEQGVRAVAKTANWLGLVEASPVQQAHPLAPGDWVVCAQSSARDLSPPYAMFFNGNTLVHYRIAVEIDDCLRVPYAPLVALPADPKRPAQPTAPAAPAGRPMGGPLVLHGEQSKQNKGRATP